MSTDPHPGDARLLRPLGRVLAAVGGQIDCMASGFTVASATPPLTFTMAGGTGEWVNDQGTWDHHVTDIDLRFEVRGHPWSTDLLAVVQRWRADLSPLTVALAASAIVHDGTGCLVLPRRHWPRAHAPHPSSSHQPHEDQT